MTDNARDVLIATVYNGLKEVSELLEPISNGLSSVTSDLRVEENEEVFRNLANWLKALQSIYNFANELSRALDYLKKMDCSFSEDYSVLWKESHGIIENMLNAFEAKDWVTVCDLIEYEVVPLLSKGRESFKRLEEELLALKGQG